MAVKIFFCYAREDEPLLEKLKIQLSPLKREGLIDIWYDRDISAGAEWEQEIREHLTTAQIILLLISPDFIASDYCYGIEMTRALERHQRGQARVIPIILRPVHWRGMLGNLQALPTDGKPVKSWSDLDEAFYNVAEGIRIVIERLPRSIQATVQDKETITHLPASIGTYTERWSTFRPGCMIYVLDQSSATLKTFGETNVGAGKRICDLLATMLNSFLNEVITLHTTVHSDFSSSVKARADIAILGYGNGKIASMLPSINRAFVSLPELQMNPLDIEMRKQKEMDDTGQEVTIPVPFPIWVRPQAGGDAPLCAALRKAHELAESWVAEHPDSYPPLVVNITASMPSDGNPMEAALQLCQLKTNDGHVLLFHAFATSLNAPPITYPASEAALPNDASMKRLFAISSVLPETSRQRLQSHYPLGELPAGARGFIINGDAVSILYSLPPET